MISSKAVADTHPVPFDALSRTDGRLKDTRFDVSDGGSPIDPGSGLAKRDSLPARDALRRATSHEASTCDGGHVGTAGWDRTTPSQLLLRTAAPQPLIQLIVQLAARLQQCSHPTLFPTTPFSGQQQPSFTHRQGVDCPAAHPSVLLS